MPHIDPLAAEKAQPELMSGEQLVWAGKPDPRVIFHYEDWSMIPFSLLWGGFAIFWTTFASGILSWDLKWRGTFGSFGLIWGLPFVVIGQYMIWGRFVHDAWLKRRTYYAIKNRRVLIIQEAWGTKVRSWFPLEAQEISREGSGRGTVWLGKRYPAIAGRGQKTQGSRFSMSEKETPALSDIDDVETVHRLVVELCRNRPESPLPRRDELTFRLID